MTTQPTLLLVDDAVVDRMLYRRLLRSDAYTIHEFDTGEAALQHCAQTMPDLILLDYLLPDVDGLEFLDRLRQQTGEQQLPVIMLTGQGSEAIAVQAIKRGAQDYLVKDKLTTEALRRTIQRSLEQLQMVQQLTWQQEQQQLMMTTALRISQSLDLQEILEISVNEVRQLLKADRVLLYQFASDMSGSVVAESVLPPWAASWGNILEHVCFRRNGSDRLEGAAGTRTSAQQRVDCHLHQLEQFQVKADLAVPIELNHADSAATQPGTIPPLWGVLVVHQCGTSREWQSYEIRLLQQLSIQLSIAIQQALLYQNLQQQSIDLQTSVSLLETTLESTAEGILAIDLNDRVIACNQEFVDLWQIQSAIAERDNRAILPLIYERLINPDELREQITQEHIHPNLENCVTLLFKNGKVYERYSKPQYLQGQIIGRVISCRDITERIRFLQQEQSARAEVEELLKELETERSRLEQVLQQMPLGVSIAEAPSGHLLFHNSEAERLLRHAFYPADSYRGYDHYGAIHADGQPYQSEEYPTAQALLLGRAVKAEEMIYRRGDNTTTILSINAAPILNSEGQVIATVSIFEDIADRKQAEATLVENEARLRAIFEQVAVGMAELSLQGEFLRVNQKLCDFLGYSKTELCQLTLAEISHPDDLVHDLNQLQQLIQGEISTYSMEKRYFRQEGSLRWGNLTVSIVRPPSGAPYIIGVVEDITDRKQAEQALKKELFRIRTVFDTLFDGIVLLDRDGYVIEANSRFAEMLGYPPADLIGLHVTDWDAQFTPAEIEVMLSDYMIQQRGVFETRHRRRDGSIYDVDISTSVGEWDGDILRFCACRDITDRKRTEVALQESEERYRLLVQNFPNGAVLLFDQDLRYILVEGQALAETGLNPAMLSGKTIWQTMDAETCAIVVPRYQATLAGEAQTFEMPFADRLYRVYTLPIRNEQGEVKLGMAMSQDITLQKQAEQTLQNAKADLEQRVQKRTQELQTINAVLQTEIADRLEAQQQLELLANDLQRSNQELEQFAYIASHDLQEPLRAITSFTQLLAREYGDRLDDDATLYMEFIVNGATRLQQLIRDLLSYSRVGRREPNRRPTDLNQILTVVYHDLQVAIEESQATITCPSLPIVSVDPNQITLLFQNLLGNAIKYRSDNPPEIEIRVVQHDQQWLFSVRDNGIGIEPQYADRIFGIFQRLHSSDEYAGTGLGLAICKKILEQHGGQIWVESQLGEGATFYFTLPLVDEGSQSSQGQGDVSRQEA